MINDTVNSLIIDLEIDTACLLDHFDEVTEQDIEKIQDKLTILHTEYIAMLNKLNKETN